jgi:hypothetical protein
MVASDSGKQAVKSPYADFVQQLLSFISQNHASQGRMIWKGRMKLRKSTYSNVP